MTLSCPAPRRQVGFTLIELAMVVLILGLLAASFLRPLRTQIEARDRAETRELLDEAIEALYGFALINGRLPCADGPGNDGIEDAAVPCVVVEGRLPWQTLGIRRADAWGNLLTYRVDPDFTVTKVLGESCANDEVGPETADFDLCELGEISVVTRGDTPGGAVQGKDLIALVSNAPAVVISHGRNGFGATRSTDSTLVGAPPLSHVDETENTNADNPGVFVSRIYTVDADDCDDADEAKTFCEFDDIVSWVSPTVLMNRMVQAGRLP